MENLEDKDVIYHIAAMLIFCAAALYLTYAVRKNKDNNNKP